MHVQPEKENDLCMSRKHYYLAKPVFSESLCSDWVFLGQAFAVGTVSTLDLYWEILAITLG